MTERIPSEQPEQLQELKPFDYENAPLTAVSYGASGGFLHLDTAIESERRELHPIDTTEEFVDTNGRRRQDVNLFMRMMTHGRDDGFSLIKAMEFDQLEDQSLLLRRNIEKFPGMESEIIALEGLARKFREMRAISVEQSVASANAYIASRPEKRPLYISAHETGLPAFEKFEAGFVKQHAIAPLVKVEFNEAGQLRSYLRQADGTLGYVLGGQKLYW